EREGVPTHGEDEREGVPPGGGDEREGVPPGGGDEKGEAIRDGMTASVVIHTDTVEDVLLVPNWAVRSDQSTGETVLYCYVLRSDGVPERRTITRGRYDETSTEILSGLEAGETVALVTEERDLLDLIPGGP
ncbi:MAG: hypothetical protein ACP5J4_07755, partial [Anaerolineae bacterium]